MVKKVDPEADDLGPDLVFAGADPKEDETQEADAVDRGDDLDAAAAAVDDDSDEELAAEQATADEDEGEPEQEAAEDEASDEAETTLEAESGEEEDEGADSDDADDEKVSNYVSKDRFNQVNERLKLAEQQLKEREEREKAAAEKEEPLPEYDFDAKEQEYAEAITDGEFEKAKAIRKEIRAAEKAEYEAAVNKVQSESTARVNDQIAFNAKVNELSAEYDAFRPGSDTYDQVLVDEVIVRQQMFLDRGNSPADALEKAAREVALLYDVPSNYEEEAAADPEPEAKKPEPKKPDIKKKVAQSKKQPPKLEQGGQGGEEEKLPTSMSDKEFEALPESTKARLRGDIV